MSDNNIVLGILAHVDAGKTTLSEAMLYLSGKLKKLGRVDHRDSFLDNNSLERARGITIFSKQAVMPLGEMTVTLLDTPGHVDFSAEAERSLQVLDYAVLVISGTDGVQAHAETLWKLLERYNMPVFIFVTKMDLPGCDRQEIMDGLRTRLSERCVDFSAEGEALFESAAMCWKRRWMSISRRAASAQRGCAICCAAVRFSPAASAPDSGQRAWRSS
ncbi:MAG: GTP-binding protein [Oscillospiraceae bacterium]